MLLGTGTGSFAAPIVVADSGEQPQRDLPETLTTMAISMSWRAGQSGLTIMLGNGTGNMVQAKSYTSGFTVFGAGSLLLPGDFNEDGKIDLAAVQRSGIGILDGDGTGAFNDALSYHDKFTNPRYLVGGGF